MPRAIRTPIRTGQSGACLYCIIVKTLNVQNNRSILKAPRETHQITDKGRVSRVTLYFSTETLKVKMLTMMILHSKRQL